MRYGEAGKHLADKDIVVEEGDCLGEDGVIVVQGRNKDPLVEDRIGQNVDEEDLPLGDWEVKEVDGDFDCRGVEDGGHNELGSMLKGTPYILYQLEFSALLLDCFHMSFQLGAVFCSSQAIRGFPCQETANRMPELEDRVYHNT